MLKSFFLSLISVLYVTSVYASDIAKSQQDNEADIQEIISRAKSENEIRDKEILSVLEKAEETISETLNSTQTAIDAVEKTVFATGRLGIPEQDIIKKDVSELKQELAHFKEETSKIIAEMRNNYTMKSSKILKAYDEYSIAISNYYTHKAQKEDLIAAGKIFKEKVASSDVSIDRQRLDVIQKITKEISLKIKDLREDILDKISNSREYSDEDESEDKTSSVEIIAGTHYVYNYHTEYNHVYLKSEYADETDGSFLMSSELVCDKLDIKNFEKSSSEIQKFRDCVTRAKTEKEYFALKGLNGCSTSKLHLCDPFQDALYAPYKNKGVYQHILEDYDAANVVNIAKTKEYSHNWQGTYDEKTGECTDGTLCEFSNKIREGTITNANDAIQFLAKIELEAAKLWSSLRRVDALHRSKKAVNYFISMSTLYLDGRDDGRSDGPHADSIAAAREHPGVVKVENKEQDVAPNVLLYVCKIKAEDISIDPEDAEDEKKKEEAEKNIEECFKTYAKWADKGTDKDKVEQGEAQKVDANKKLWKEKEFAAATDSTFKNLTTAAINLYKSSLDFREEPPEDGINIVTLEEGLKEKATQVLDGYAAGAKINYYTTNQILSIVNADALELQNEIIQNLSEMGYNFFQIEEGGK